MASAPPIEVVMPLTAPLPPSYEEAMNHPYPHCSQNPTYPPPGYGPKNTPVYPVQPQSPPVTCHPVVSVQSVYVQPGLVFSDHPVVMNCPACRQMITTQLEYNSGALAWLSCAGLAIFGCIYGCCLIPFCVDSLKDVTHYCPNCKNVLGVYKRL
ncbi:lipopolysaccharide-induced tumor necrosis factor-alpha factor homolog [Lepisosteus oculatus]|nr:PREDICTED: lipopolysaccharide-induced tumor necrosis factor-alpha factor homolog [Lepisosteus oculatus]